MVVLRQTWFLGGERSFWRVSRGEAVEILFGDANFGVFSMERQLGWFQLSKPFRNNFMGGCTIVWKYCRKNEIVRIWWGGQLKVSSTPGRAIQFLTLHIHQWRMKSLGNWYGTLKFIFLDWLMFRNEFVSFFQVHVCCIYF